MKYEWFRNCVVAAYFRCSVLWSTPSLYFPAMRRIQPSPSPRKAHAQHERQSERNNCIVSTWAVLKEWKVLPLHKHYWMSVCVCVGVRERGPAGRELLVLFFWYSVISLFFMVFSSKFKFLWLLFLAAARIVLITYRTHDILINGNAMRYRCRISHSSHKAIESG